MIRLTLWEKCNFFLIISPGAGKDWGQKAKEETEDEIDRWLGGITDSIDLNLSKFQEMVKDRKAWHAAVQGSQRVRYNWSDLAAAASPYCVPRIVVGPSHTLFIFSFSHNQPRRCYLLHLSGLEWVSDMSSPGSLLGTAYNCSPSMLQCLLFSH